MSELALEGIVLNINNKQIQVYFVCGVFEGDNKEVNRSLDFPNSHSAIHFCRHCRLDRYQMSRATEEDLSMRRTEDNYYEDVLTNNLTLTGIKAWSVFNTLPFFHVINGSQSDPVHDLLEGIYPYGHNNTLSSLILDHGRKYFTLDQLNARIKAINYGPDECGNIPAPISEKNLKDPEKKKLKMTAAEMFNFTHNITFLLGDLIPEIDDDGDVDPVWTLILNMVKLLDLCYLPWYEPENIVELRDVIKVFLTDYKELFGYFQPVFHYLIHYPTNTEIFGPQRDTRILRYFMILLIFINFTYLE